MILWFFFDLLIDISGGASISDAAIGGASVSDAARGGAVVTDA